MKKYIKKKSLICFLVCFIAISLMVGCSNNDKSVVGEWYAVEYDGSFIDAQNIMACLDFYDDGTCYDYFCWEEYNYKVQGDTITIIHTYDDGTSVDIEYKMTEEDGCIYLSCSNVHTGMTQKLVKGEEAALSYLDETSTNASNIWNYDFAGDYYRAEDDELSHLSEYDQMVEMKLAGGGYTVFGSFSLSDDYSGYEHTRYGSSYALTVDLDRENKTMVLIGPDGYATDYTIEWCEEIQEWVFNSGSDYYCKLDNVE